jgi:hypothetical protein
VLIAMNGLWLRLLAAWMACATSSLPEPDGPARSTDTSDAATRAIIARNRCMAALVPMMSEVIERSISATVLVIIAPSFLALSRRRSDGFNLGQRG